MFWCLAFLVVGNFVECRQTAPISETVLASPVSNWPPSKRTTQGFNFSLSHMGCTVQRMPGLGELNSNSMSERGSSMSPHPHVGASTSMRAALPSRALSKEDIEIAEQLVDHSQGSREVNVRLQNIDKPSSPSTTYEPHDRSMPLGAGSPFERTSNPTSRSEAESNDRTEPSEIFRSQAIPTSEAQPVGQVCR